MVSPPSDRHLHEVDAAFLRGAFPVGMQPVARGHGIEFGAGPGPELIEVGLCVHGGFDPFGVAPEGERGGFPLPVPERCAVEPRCGLEFELEPDGVAASERIGLLEDADGLSGIGPDVEAQHPGSRLLRGDDGPQGGALRREEDPAGAFADAHRDPFGPEQGGDKQRREQEQTERSHLRRGCFAEGVSR